MIIEQTSTLRPANHPHRWVRLYCTSVWCSCTVTVYYYYCSAGELNAFRFPTEERRLSWRVVSLRWKYCNLWFMCSGRTWWEYVCVCVQAQQQIPDWLEEMSAATTGIGNFTGAAGRFEARDSRSGNVSWLTLMVFLSGLLWKSQTCAWFLKLELCWGSRSYSWNKKK